MLDKLKKKKLDKLAFQPKSISKKNLSEFIKEPAKGIEKDNKIQIAKKTQSIVEEPIGQINEKENEPINSDSLESLKDPKNLMSSVEVDKSQHLFFEIEKIPEKTIKPIIDFNENSISYPILTKIGKEPNDVQFLDGLVTDGILRKKIHEKLIICPHHRDEFSSSVKLYCPKCNSVNVKKLNLFEHVKCGFITENSNYDFSNPENSKCPSCKRDIVDFKKEIKIPAMWHQCAECNEKFDNAIIKMFCRRHEHDFDINSGHFVTTYSYQVIDQDDPISAVDGQTRDDLISLFKDLDFSAEFKALIKGKSGNHHKVPIFAKNNSNRNSIAVFFDYGPKKISKSDINSLLIPTLDIGPNYSLLISSKGATEEVRSIAKQYGIEIISDSNPSNIIEKVDEFITNRFSQAGEN